MKSSVRNPPRSRHYFSRPERAFSIEKYNISHSVYHSKFHRTLRLPRKVTLQLHQILRRTNQQKWHLNFTKCCTCHEKRRLNCTKCCACYDDAITGRFYGFTMLLLDDAITWRCSYLTMLLLDDAITLPCYYLTMLLLNDAVTWRCYYLTMLILNDAITTMLLLNDGILFVYRKFLNLTSFDQVYMCLSTKLTLSQNRAGWRPTKICSAALYKFLGWNIPFSVEKNTKYEKYTYGSKRSKNTVTEIPQNISPTHIPSATKTAHHQTPPGTVPRPCNGKIVHKILGINRWACPKKKDSSYGHLKVSLQHLWISRNFGKIHESLESSLRTTLC